jgi:hypothetical protein
MNRGEKGEWHCLVEVELIMAWLWFFLPIVVLSLAESFEWGFPTPGRPKKETYFILYQGLL